MVIQGVNYPSDFEAKKAMIEIGRRMYEKGSVIAGDGSLSVRVGPNAVWITVADADKGAMKQDSFLRVDMNGRQMPGSRGTRLPEDLAVHLQVYNQNPALRAVLHAYPAGAVALAAKGRGVEPADYTPSVRALGKLDLVQAGNADEAAKAAAMACKTDTGVLLGGDGCVIWGESITEAFHKLEAVEYYARISRMLCGGAGHSGSAGHCGGTGAGMAACGTAGSGCSTAGGHMAVYGAGMAGSGLAGAVGDGGAGGNGSGLAAGAGFGVGAVQPEAFEMEGLTSVIRPGEAFPAAETAGAVSAGNAPRTVSAAGSVPAQPQAAPSSMREQTMAEVVRRSLAAMK